MFVLYKIYIKIILIFRMAAYSSETDISSLKKRYMLKYAAKYSLVLKRKKNVTELIITISLSRSCLVAVFEC